jgi:hypothetical protein
MKDLKLQRLGRWALAAALLTDAGAAHSAQPTYATPPGQPLLPNILYVVPYAAANQPFGNGQVSVLLPGTVTEITIGIVKKCRLQVEWVNWDGTTVGVSGPPTPPPPLAVSGALEFHTQNDGPTAYPPYILNVGSNITGSTNNITGAFEGHANIRSDCKPNTKLKVDAGLVVIQAISGPPLYKPIPTIRPDGTTGD